MLNEVKLIGYLGRDPELRYTQGGSPVCSFSIATSRKYTDKRTNEKVEETEWHRISVFGKLAEVCNNYLQKGRLVHVSGRLKTRQWDKDGQTHYSTDIISDSVVFLPSSTGAPERSKASSKPGSKSEPEPYDPGGYSPAGPVDDDDIPF
jgi:single-strand DNA-binding protein